MPSLKLSEATTNSCKYVVTLSSPFNTSYYKKLRITSKYYDKSTSDVDLYLVSVTATNSTKPTSGIINNGMSAGNKYTLHAYAQALNGIWYLAGTCDITMKNIQTSKTLNLPYKNHNQRWNGAYSDGTNFNPNGSSDVMFMYGCSRCSVACVLSSIAGYEVSPLNIPHSGGNVYFAGIPAARVISKSISYSTSGTVTLAGGLSAIRDYIDAGHPAIIRCSCNGNHFCVAYGYVNGAATTADILTYDTIYPKGSDLWLTSQYGEVKTLERVISLNSMSSISEVFTYKK